MRRIWRVFVTDLKNSRMNVVACVICIGMVVVPALYAWFNIAGAWDPYGNTKNLKVAVANTDEGYESTLLPMSINVGDKIVSALYQNEEIGWVFTNEQDAIDGVTSGEYYAAIVIPKDFSTCLLGMLSGQDEGKAVLTYYDNEKENSIASIVTDKASAAVKEQIDTTFSKTISEIGTTVIGDLSGYMDDGSIRDFATKLDTTLGNLINDLGSTQDTVDSYATLIDSAQSLVSGSQTLLSQTATNIQTASGNISTLADKLSVAATNLQGTTASVTSSIDKAVEKLDSLDKTISSMLDTTSGEASDRSKDLGDLASAASSQGSALHDAADKANAAGSQYKDVADRIDRAGDAMDDLGKTLQDASDKASDRSGSLSDSKDKIKGEIASAKDQLTSASDAYEKKVTKDLSKIASDCKAVAANARAVSDKTAATLDTLTDLAGSSSQDLSTIATALRSVSADISETSAELSQLKAKIETALDTGDMKLLEEVLSSGTDTLSTYLSSPVSLKKIPVYAVENNGSGMAPYFSTLALWVGGIVLIVMLKSDVTEDELAICDAKVWHGVMGRMLTFMFFGALQGLLLGVGDLIFVQIQCVEPWLFLLALMVTGAVYTAIIYAFTSAFGDLGKAVAILLLVLQVAGSGGTFPSQMLPQVFQDIYPYLPFVSSMTAMRGCIAGIYGNDYLIAMLKLCAFMIPVLIICLGIRPLVIRGTRWIDEQLESTKVM